MKLLQSLKENNKKAYVFCYTLLFLLLAPLVFLWFLKDGRSFIWINDGGDQHFIALLYYGRLLREWISGMFQGQGFAFPLYDFAIGQGDDVITTLHYYCLGDPLALFSVFCPEQYTEYLYNFLVLLRFYLMGLSFMAFGFYQKKEGKYVLLGAFLYAFCGFALIGAIKHPFFLNPMIYLPLLCLAIEKVLKKESSRLFIAMTALCAMSNFYFFYMLTALAVIYAIVRFCCMYLPERKALKGRSKQKHPERNGVKKQLPEWMAVFLEIVPRGIGAYIAGVGISAVIFLPVVMRFLNNPRYVEDASKLKSVYSLNYYGRMLGSFTGKAWTPGYWAFFGFAPVVILALCVLFTKKERKVRSLQIFTVIGFVFLLFPVFGYILNGFDYVSNRWMFAFHFLMAYIVTAMLPELLAGMSKWAVRLNVLVIIGLTLVNGYSFFNGNRVDEVAYVLLLLVSGFCIYMGKQAKKTYYYAGLFVLTLFCVVWNGSTALKSKRSQFYPAGELYKYVKNQPSSELTAPKEDTFYRVDSYIAKNWTREYGVENPTKEDLLAFFNTNNGIVVEDVVDDTGMDEAVMGDEDIDDEEASTENQADGEMSDSETAENEPGQELEEKPKKVKKQNHYNLSLVHGYYGLSEYFSMLNPYYPVYVNKMALSSSNYSSQIASLDQRTALNALASVKYYMASDFECYRVPYGYKELAQYEAEDGKTMTLYENQYALPLAFTYDKWIAEETLGNMSPLKRQELMLKVLVLSEGQDTAMLPAALEKALKSEVITKEVVWSENNTEAVVKKEKSITFPYAKSWAEFTMERVENCEVYVYLQDVKFSKSSAALATCADGVYKWTNIYSKSQKTYFGRNNILFNLGYYEDGLDSFALYTSKPGKLSFKKLSVLLVPMDTYEEKIAALQEETLENIRMSTNRMEGTVNASEDKLLFFSVPYSKGVRATVNGEAVPVYRANELYLAVPVQEGDNTVVLTYRTPGLAAGVCISFGTLCALGMCLIWTKKRKNALEMREYEK